MPILRKIKDKLKQRLPRSRRPPPTTTTPTSGVDARSPLPTGGDVALTADLSTESAPAPSNDTYISAVAIAPVIEPITPPSPARGDGMDPLALQPTPTPTPVADHGTVILAQVPVGDASETSHITKDHFLSPLKYALKLLEKVSDDTGVPGLKGAVGALVMILDGVDVSYLDYM